MSFFISERIFLEGLERVYLLSSVRSSLNLKNELAESVENMNVKQERYLKTFKQNLLAGVEYYKSLPFPNWNDMLPDLKQMESRIEALVIPSLERNMA